MIFALFVFIGFSRLKELYVSPDGVCEEDNDCQDESNPCSLMCPFFENNQRLNDGQNKILMMSGDYNLEGYEILWPNFHLAEISKNDVQIVFKPYFEEGVRNDSSIIWEGFPTPETTNNGSLFYISGKGVTLELHNFTIYDLHPRMNESFPFEGFLFSSSPDFAEIESIVLENMELNSFEGFFSQIGFTPPFSMTNTTIRELVLKNCSIISVNTPIYLRLSSSDRLNSFHLLVEDSYYENGRTDIITDVRLSQDYNYENSLMISEVESHFGVRQDGFATIYGQQEEPSSNIVVDLRRTVITKSSITSAIQLIDLEGDTDFFLNMEDCEISHNENLLDIIYLSLSQIIMNMTNTRIIYNTGVRGNNLRSVLIMDELELFHHDLYDGYIYLVDLTFYNSTISSNGAFSIFSFPFLENYMMYISMNFTQVDFRNNYCDTIYFSNLPYRQSSVFTFTQLGSYKSTIGKGISFTDCEFEANEGFRYIIYFSPGTGFLPSHTDNVLQLSGCRFLDNQVVFNLFKYHPYGPQPNDEVIKSTRIKIVNCVFRGNKGEVIFNDQRNEINYETNHDYPLLVIENCQFHENIVSQGSILQFIRPKKKRYAPAVLIDTDIIDNYAVLGGAVLGQNIYIFVRNVYVSNNVANFGGGFFLKNAIITSVAEDDDINNFASEAREYNLTVVDNRANKSGGGVYCSNCVKSWIDSHVDPSTFRFDGNIMGNDKLTNIVMGTPIRMKLIQGVGDEVNDCHDQGGQKVWICHLNEIHLFDQFEQDIVEPTYEDLPLHLKVYYDDEVFQSLSVSTSSRRKKGGYDFLFFSQDIDVVTHDTLKLSVEFTSWSDDKEQIARRQTFQCWTDVTFDFIHFPFWALPLAIIVLVINAILIVCVYLICFVCSSVVCVYVGKSSDYYQEKRMKEYFDSYPREKLHELFSKEAEKILKKTGSNRMLFLSNTNQEEEEEEEEERRRRKRRRNRRRNRIKEPSLMKDEEEDSESVVAIPSETDSLLVTNNIQGVTYTEEEEEKQKRKSEEEFEFDQENNEKKKPISLRMVIPQDQRFEIVFSDHHIFKGNPNGKAGIYYFNKNPRLKKNLYPVFIGSFLEGQRHGKGVEYHIPKSAKKKEDPIIKFEGIFAYDKRHGKGKEFSKADNRSFIVGEWKEGTLERIIYNNHSVKIIDLERDITFSELIYPPNEEDPSIPTRIWQGKMKQGTKRQASSQMKECVVKIFKDDGSGRRSQRITEFLRVERLKKLERNVKILSLYNHPNIIMIYGWSGDEKKEIYYVMESCKLNVIQELQKWRRNIEKSKRKKIRTRLLHQFEMEKIRLLLSIAKGMVHLHVICGLIHRDLKASNVLLDRLGNPKIIDFEMSVMSEKEWSGKKNNVLEEFAVGSPYHIAVECLDTERNYCFDNKCDVYSFGILMFEILYDHMLDDPFGIQRDRKCWVCGEQFTGDILNGEDLIEFMRRHVTPHGPDGRRLRPNIEESEEYMKKKEEQYQRLNDDDEEEEENEGEESEEEEEGEVVVREKEEEEGKMNWKIQLMVRCWDENPRNRPDFTEIVEIIESKMTTTKERRRRRRRMFMRKRLLK